MLDDEMSVDPVEAAQLALAAAEVRHRALMAGFTVASGRHAAAAWDLVGRGLAAVADELRPYVMAVEVALRACAEANAALCLAREALAETFTSGSSGPEWWSGRLTCLRHVRYRTGVARTLSTELGATRARLDEVVAGRRVITQDDVDRVTALARELDVDELNVIRREVSHLRDVLWRVQSRRVAPPPESPRTSGCIGADNRRYDK